MSLYGALNIGVAALDANSAALSVTSSNIANTNTVGYKTAQSHFSTFLSSVLGVGDPSTAGVNSSATQSVTTQGLLQTTGSATDLAISGNGFFVVSPVATSAQNQEFTRAGSFLTDATGNLKNSGGQYLLGWKLDANGNPPTNPNDLTFINVTTLAGKASPTTKMTLQANLQASATMDSTYAAGDMTAGNVAPDFQRTLNVYDSQGGSQPIELSFVKTAANTWAYEATYQGDSTKLASANPIGSGTMTFNADGSLANVNGASPASGAFSLTVPWNPATSGLTPQTMTINVGSPGQTDGFTQFDNTSVLTGSTVDGAVFGNVSGLTIGQDGTVSAEFSNGLSQAVFKLPLATFPNADGLSQVSGNAYAATAASGTAIINAANTGGSGQVESSQLESSTVDLATEFTNLITTQRAYSASARIITTADAMLQTLEQLQ